MGIPLNLDFTMGVAKPIDSRFVMTKAEMLAANDAVMPPVYGCWCSEDGRYYIYNKGNTASLTTGKFALQPDEVALRILQSNIDAHAAFGEQISLLQMQMEDVQNIMKANKQTNVITGKSFVEGVWKMDFLPDHDQSKFCQEFEMSYTGTFSAETADTAVINGQTVNLGNTHSTTESETNTLKVVRNMNSLDVYCNNSLVGNITDTIILTVQVNSANFTEESVSATDVYTYVEYTEVDVKSKNGYAISEGYDGTIVYWNRAVQIGTVGKIGTLPYSFSEQQTKAVYAVGTALAGAYTFGLMMSAWTEIDESHYSVADENIVRYCYMANWDLSAVTKLYCVFSNWAVNSTAVASLKAQDPLVFRKGIKKLDFTKSKYCDSGDLLTFDRITHRSPCTSLGSFQGIANAIANLSNSGNGTFRLQDNYKVRSYGDLSKINMSKVKQIGSCFSNCHELEFVGDIGKWNITSAVTTASALFRLCFKLRCISAEIANWDMSNVNGLNALFESTLHIGDDTVKDLGKWNVSKCQNMRSTFSYFAPRMLNSTNVDENLIDDKDLRTLVENANSLANDELTEEQRRAKEMQNITMLQYMIIDKKTDLSFVEQWTTTSFTRLEDFFAFNPFLVNVGDLRKWNLPNLSPSQGARGMFQYCIALESIKFPTFAAGVDITDIVRGCFALANIEINALSNDISFEDCPLTKQSVINLINAATTDIAITLKPSVYEAYAQDSDVVAALAAKAGDSINVSLTTTE